MRTPIFFEAGSRNNKMHGLAEGPTRGQPVDNPWTRVNTETSAHKKTIHIIMLFTPPHSLSSSYVRLRRVTRRRIMEANLSLLPLGLLQHQEQQYDHSSTNNSKPLQMQQQEEVDDISITPSTCRRHDRVSREYAEINNTTSRHHDDDIEDACYKKLVVGFLVPTLLIVQWGVEWHNDGDYFANGTEQVLAASSLLSILLYMMLAPYFIQMTYTTTIPKYQGLIPVLLLCLADILVVLRMDWSALTIMVLGNVYMAGLMARNTKSSTNSIVMSAADDVGESSSTSLTEGLLLSGSSSEQRAHATTIV
jgi:hypothetical protein